MCRVYYNIIRSTAIISLTNKQRESDGKGVKKKTQPSLFVLKDEVSQMLRIDKVTKEFPQSSGGRKRVLEDISLKIEDNEFVCILGKSGCGKSTLLNLLAGYTVPDYGALYLDRNMIHGPSADRGIVFQEYALYPWYTVLQNVAFGPSVRKDLNAEEIAMQYIKMIGLEKYKDYYPDSLSGGMRQRVGIARALANNPRILLMDEPFSALDPYTREKMREELLNIWETEKTTVIFITHSVPEAVYLADRVVMIKSGKIKMDEKIDIPRKREMNNPKFVEYVNRFEAMLSDGNQVAKTTITND